MQRVRDVREKVPCVRDTNRWGREGEEGGTGSRDLPRVRGLQAGVRTGGALDGGSRRTGDGAGNRLAAGGRDGDRAGKVPEPAVRRLRPARPRRPARGDADRRRTPPREKSAAVAAGAVALLPGPRGRLKGRRRTAQAFRNQQEDR